MAGCGPPYSCVTELVDEYMTCGRRLTLEQEAAATTAWREVTELRTFDWDAAIPILSSQAQDLFYINSVLFFAPFVLLISVFLWIFVVAGKLMWETEYFFYLLAAYLLYGFGMIYRIAAKNNVVTSYDQIKALIDADRAAADAAIAYIPQALLAASCAIVAAGQCAGEDPWTCNNC